MPKRFVSSLSRFAIFDMRLTEYAGLGCNTSGNSDPSNIRLKTRVISINAEFSLINDKRLLHLLLSSSELTTPHLKSIVNIFRSTSNNMKAITLSNPGKPSTYIYKDVPKPEPLQGHVIIEIKAFGINHAELYMRHGDWPETAEISGIECVGIVDSCPDGTFKVGAKVAAVMGGMGRSIPGSYGEYTRVPISNITSIESDLSWEELAAIPESYSTAWTCLFQNLELQKGQTLLVRGGTSALGQAAINLAVNAGANVIATTRSAERAEMLLKMGVQRIELESVRLSTLLAEGTIVDSVLNLVGNSVMLDSLAIVRRGGRVCLAGFLGGLEPMVDFNPLLQMPSGVHFSFFGSFVYGTPAFPLSDVPLQKIANDLAACRYVAKPSRVFAFEDIEEAHKVMEESRAGGKMVVKLGSTGGDYRF